VHFAWARPRRAGGRQLQADVGVPPSFCTEPAANVLTIIRTAEADGDRVCVRPTSQQGVRSAQVTDLVLASADANDP
jgi:hypothetical protein